jgi:hypothetical protein
MAVRTSRGDREVNQGSVRVRDGVDLTAPALDDIPEAQTGRELAR